MLALILIAVVFFALLGLYVAKIFLLAMALILIGVFLAGVLHQERHHHY